MIISKTPMRVSFLGGGTDYPQWFNEHEGAVLSTTIDKFTYISTRWLPPFFEHKYRVVWSLIENVNTVDEIQHPIVKECLKYLGIEKGIAINHDADLPARSGLGTSSVFTVGLLNALYHLTGQSSPGFLADQAITIERERLKQNIGSQDQVAAAVGGLNLIKFGGETEWHAQRINISTKRLQEFESYLMLVFTGFPHNASDVAGTYKFSNNFRVMYEMALEGRKILEDGYLTDFGKLLDEAWEVKKTLSSEITTPYIDYVYERAKKAGALGGKLLGAGGGGFMLIFCEPDKQRAVKEALKGLLFVPFKIEPKGTRIIANGEG